MNISKTLFDTNVVTGNGGAIYSKGDIYITDSTFANNKADFGGSIISRMRLYINNTSFRTNEAINYGGTIANFGKLRVINTTYHDNNAKYGGAIATTTNVKASTQIYESQFTENTAVSGGAVYAYGNTSLEVSKSLFNENSDNSLFIKITNPLAKIINSSITKSVGSAIRIDSSTLNVEKTVLSSNKASNGAAIYNYKAYTTIKNSIILNNNNGDVYNDKGRVVANYNWRGSNDKPSSDRIKNVDLSNWIYMTLNVDNSGTPNKDVTINVSLSNLYDGNKLSLYNTYKIIPYLGLKLNIKGCGANENIATTIAGSYKIIRSYSQTGTLNVTADISSQVISDLSNIKSSAINSKITSLYVQRLTTVTASDVKTWNNVGITDVYVLTSVSDYDTSNLRKVISLCKNTNIRVHAWVICFKLGSSFDISTARQNAVKNFINYVIKIDCCAGVVLYYVRYSGLNPSSVNPNVITNFVKEVHKIVKSYDSNKLVSAAVFAEKTATKTYYGQDYAAMSPYVDVMLPMAYKYDYTPTRAWLKDVTEYVVKQAKYSRVVTTLQTYKEVGGSLPKLSASELEGDAQAVMSVGSYGYSLFRFGLISSYPRNAEKLS